jgi:hypothetical protein
VKVTLNFSGGGTVNWLGEEWSDGTTHYICPTSYNCGTYNATPGGVACGTTYNYVWRRETWTALNTNDKLYLRGVTTNQTPHFIFDHRARRNVQVCGASLGKGTGGFWGLGGTVGGEIRWGMNYTNCNTGLNTTTYTYSAPTRLSTNRKATQIAATKVVDGAPVGAEQFGQLTTNGGVTITWERAFPSDWNTCGL